jgi:hypothetical protein
MTKEALDLALEALEFFKGLALSIEEIERAEEAITAIKQARSAPVQEPVAWGCNRYIEDDNGFQIGTDEPELAWGKYAPDDNGWWPLYTTPPAQPAPVQEPVGVFREDDDIGYVDLMPHQQIKLKDGDLVYITPPNVATPLAAQRQSARSAWVHATEWRGLTDEEREGRVEPVDTLIAAWQALEETSGHVLDVGDVEGRMHMSVIRSAWEKMDSLVREIWDERGRP